MKNLKFACLSSLWLLACNGAPVIDHSETSLFGTDLDGALRVDADEALVVDEALRQRFDHFLLLEGEVSSDVLDAHVRQHFGEMLPEPAVTVAGETWAAYLTYRVEARRLWESSGTDRYESMRALRREILGADTAERFFGEEERAAASAQAERRMTPRSDRSAPRPAGLLDRLRALRAHTSDPDALLQARTELVGEEAARRLGELDRQRE
ncbi:MAG: hypothetical protein AAFX94_20290 [Myxococcota bacterium]